MTYFIQTFGCAANTADSERIATMLRDKGIKPARSVETADYVVINTCMVRESAENRVYGLLHNLQQQKKSVGPQLIRLWRKEQKIILTGCLVGMAVRDGSGKTMKRLRRKFPMVDEFLPIEEVGFDILPLRQDKIQALVPISNGCNNFCTYCVVPFTRGREKSRPYAEITAECLKLKAKGYQQVTLVGQNVNSYGSDIIKGVGGRGLGAINTIKICRKEIKPVMVKSMGKNRIPTLFPYLLEDIAKMGFGRVDFISSNPWDFSPELIRIIAGNPNISREIHLPVQSGDNEILKKMNRFYTREEYLQLVKGLKSKIKSLKLSTDIIVGFPGETKVQFHNTVDLCKKVGFYKAYISEYSDRPMTAAHKLYRDDIAPREKKRRWLVLERLINRQFRNS